MRTLARVCVAALLSAGVALSAQQLPDRTKPPVTGPVPALKLPMVQKRQLANGLPVWIVELHEVPVVQVNLVVLSGSGDDQAGQYGLASLTAAMLSEGAGTRSALQIADAVDFLGADLTTASGIDSSAVRLHVPVARLADALPIMADVALRPSFPKDDLERLRKQRLTNLLQARADAATTDALAFSRVLYGTAHRYGTATVGTAATLAKFTTDDLRAFYRAAFRPDASTIMVVGDVTPEKVLPMLEKHFGSWRSDGSARGHVAPPSPPERTRREVYLVDKPGAPQTEIRIGSVGVARSTPDYFPIEVLDSMLGGSFSSRLNMNLREKHGYTYGASSAFDMRSSAGPFIAAAAVQSDKTSEALKEFFNELNGILQLAPPEEVSRAKHYMELQFPEAFETTGDVSGRLEQLLVYHLPDDYYAGYVRSIEAVTPEDVQRVAQKYIHPDRVAVVVVGDRKLIEPGIQALNLGPINIVTPDDVFGPAQ